MDIPQERNNVNVIYPYVKSTVPTWACIIIGFLPTILVIVLVGIKKKSVVFTTFCLLSFIFSVLLVNGVTNLGKLFAGRPRPHTYDRIDTKGEIDDSFKSFPSGHSSTIFNAMTFLSLLVAGQLKVFSNGFESWKIILTIIPYIVAGTVAISRTRDYHHNFSDILGGTLIGILLTVIVYFTKFKSLTSEQCDEMKIEDIEKEGQEIDLDEESRMVSD